MIRKAHIRNVPLAPRKARLLADLVRGMTVGKAMECLQVNEKRGAPIFAGLIKSASNSKRPVLDSTARIVTIAVDQGRLLRRSRIKGRGRASLIRKRASHISLVLS